jgi:hypothetical protein
LGCLRAALGAKASGMQLGPATLSDRSPCCPRCPRAKAIRMHRHGSYRRKRGGGARVERFCCPVCRLSCTVLPPGLLPYRSSSVQQLEQHFDQRLAVESVVSAVQRPRALERALQRLRPSPVAVVRPAGPPDQPRPGEPATTLASPAQDPRLAGDDSRAAARPLWHLAAERLPLPESRAGVVLAGRAALVWGVPAREGGRGRPCDAKIVLQSVPRSPP